MLQKKLIALAILSLLFFYFVVKKRPFKITKAGLISALLLAVLLLPGKGQTDKINFHGAQQILKSSGSFIDVIFFRNTKSIPYEFRHMSSDISFRLIAPENFKNSNILEEAGQVIYYVHPELHGTIYRVSEDAAILYNLKKADDGKYYLEEFYGKFLKIPDDALDFLFKK